MIDIMVFYNFLHFVGKIVFVTNFTRNLSLILKQNNFATSLDEAGFQFSCSSFSLKPRLYILGNHKFLSISLLNQIPIS
uniref:Uncharacterized protein n=1 Tax=Helianthus annuus TaxID=4232 RepID=A0A251SYJ4_HELAN